MAAEQSENPELEIKSDEGWKERVKAEDAKLDAESPGSDPPPADAASAPAAAAAEMATDDEIDPSQIPPADFPMLVQTFYTQAIVALGQIPSPVSGEPQPQPAVAKHFIDLLGVIEEKTEGNLTNPERNLLVDALHHLRMAYVELVKQD